MTTMIAPIIVVMTRDSGDRHSDHNNDSCGNSGISNDGDNNSCASICVRRTNKL